MYALQLVFVFSSMRCLLFIYFKHYSLEVIASSIPHELLEFFLGLPHVPMEWIFHLIRNLRHGYLWN